MKYSIYIWSFLALQVYLASPVTGMEIKEKPMDTYVREHPYFHNVNGDEANNIITNSAKGNVLFCNSSSPHEFLIVFAIVCQGYLIPSLKLTCNEDLQTINHHAFGDCLTLTATLSTLQKWLEGFAVFVPSPILNPILHENWLKFDNLKEAIKQDHDHKMALTSESQQKMKNISITSSQTS